MGCITFRVPLTAALPPGSPPPVVICPLPPLRSVRFALLGGAEGCGEDGARHHLPRCQLRGRHWVIRDPAGDVRDEVRGEGVIGEFPILTSGGPEFVYQSCTQESEVGCTMGGEFEFVPGTLQQPAGPPFAVTCPTFRLDLPSVVF